MTEPPAKRARSRLNNRHLPSELIGEILLNLPLKSLLRFSTVSKSWNSMIFDPVFGRKHKNRAALLRRHRLGVCLHDYDDTVSAACFLALISSDHRITVRKRLGYGSGPSFSVFSNAKDDVFDFAGQFEKEPYLLAYCDELWCVQVEKSLFLCNPSMRNIVELPSPSSFTEVGYRYGSMFGLAYDSVNDDYKILKIGNHRTTTAELYSLKNDCWRKIEPAGSFPLTVYDGMRFEFVGGRFHWTSRTTDRAPIIAYFDLSSEMYGEVALPNEYDNKEGDYRDLKVVALRGMLCACVNYRYYNEDEAESRFVLWEMKEYGVEKSWAKMCDIMIPRTTRLDHDECGKLPMLTPLYLSDNNDLLVKTHCCCGDHTFILVYRNGEARPKKIVKYENWKERNYEVVAFHYVESLITHNIFLKDKIV